MEHSLSTFIQGKMTVVEYEVGFNNLVRFVSVVANDDREKAKWF